MGRNVNFGNPRNNLGDQIPLALSAEVPGSSLGRTSLGNDFSKSTLVWVQSPWVNFKALVLIEHVIP